MLTFQSPGPSAPVWFLLGPGVQSLSSCPGSWRDRAGGREGGSLVHWRVAVLLLSWVELRDILGQIKAKAILARLGLSYCCGGGGWGVLSEGTEV